MFQAGGGVVQDGLQLRPVVECGQGAVAQVAACVHLGGGGHALSCTDIAPNEIFARVWE
jgi:hypothetical protein